MRQLSTNWQLRLPKWVTTLRQHMSPAEKTVLAALIILLITSATLTITGYIKRHTHLIPQPGGSYREATVGQPRYINPILAGANDLDLDISRLVYSPLFRLDNDLQLQNDIATDYSISDDQKEYTIHLRDNVRWHDGEPLTAADVIFTIRSIQTPEYGSPLATAFQGVEVEQLDDYTVLFILKQPYALFLNTLTVGIVPQHVWESIPPKTAPLAEQMLKPVGSGPFKFAEITTRRKTGEVTSFHLVRNEDYHSQSSYLDEITFIFLPTHEEAIQALLSSKVDGLSFVPLPLSDAIKSRRQLVLHRLLLPQYFALFFNQHKSEVLSDAGVRAALALATDRERIVAEALQHEGDPVHLPIPPGVFAYNDHLPAPTYDPEVAKQNLDESGWKDDDGDGVREKDDQRLRVKIATTDWPEYIRTAELIQEQWGQIGVETEIESFGAGTIQQTVVSPREYEVLLFGEILSSQPDPYPFWHSTQTRSPGLNLSLFKDKDVDKLLEEARKTNSEDERREKYIIFQEKILDLNPAIILYRPYYLFAQKKQMRGVDAYYVDLPAGRFNDVEQWHINTKRVWNEN